MLRSIIATALITPMLAAAGSAFAPVQAWRDCATVGMKHAGKRVDHRGFKPLRDTGLVARDLLRCF
jgi:hypothetical protein